MANRLIGVELGAQSARIAVLRRDQGGIAVLALEERSGEDPAALIRAVAARPDGTFSLSDRLAAAMPAGQAYVRTLELPFRDRRKIKAAAPFDLAAQIPVAIETCTTALLWPRSATDRGAVVAAAVPTAAISGLLDPFDEGKVPLHILDLMPFALLGGISDRLGDGILICTTGEETTISLVDHGEVRDYRLIPGALDPHNPWAVSQLLRECQVLQGQGKDERPVYLTGAGASAGLLDNLSSRGLNATLLALTLGGREIAPAFVPAVALALRAEAHRAGHSFNLRQGPFAYRGELRAVKRAAATVFGLLGLTLLVVAAAAYINYRDRARQAEMLQREMVQIYQSAFPGTTLSVDVALQMQSKLRELHNSAEELGLASQPPPWRILRELSELPAQVQIELEEFTCGNEEVRIGGTTDSFEAVNRIRDHLARSALFSSVEVAESRKSLDGSRVEFRLRLPLAGPGGRP